jgi:hypothetical protein
MVHIAVWCSAALPVISRPPCCCCNSAELSAHSHILVPQANVRDTSVDSNLEHYSAQALKLTTQHLRMRADEMHRKKFADYLGCNFDNC